MNSLFRAAAAVSFVVPCAALAGGHEEGGGPPGGLPPAVISQINLGDAGLLAALYSGSQKGVTGSRAGQDAIRVGTAFGTDTFEGYQHESATWVSSIGGSKLIQQGSAYLSFELGLTVSDEAPNLTSFGTEIPSVKISYENFSDPNAVYKVSLAYEERTTQSDTSPVVSEADSVELGFGYARKLSDNWGLVNQTYLTVGDLVVTTPGGQTIEPEVALYTQLEAVGAFGSDQLGFVPEGWKLHPIFGASFEQTTTETDAGDTQATQGSIWAKATLAKGARPGAWAPNVTLGLEHVYDTGTANEFMDEDTYLIAGVGAIHLGETGSLTLVLEHREGLNGNRSYTTLVTGYSFSF